MAGEAGHDEVRSGLVRLGAAGRAGSGTVGRGPAGHGWAGRARFGRAWLVVEWLGRQGRFWLGRQGGAGIGVVRSDEACYGRRGQARRERSGVTGRVTAWQAKRSPSRSVSNTPGCNSLAVICPHVCADNFVYT